MGRQGYLYFWRDQGDLAPLSSEQANALFGNVDDIYRFNSQFLTQLQSCGLDPVEVARCFVRNNSGFTIYTDYCTNYPRWAIRSFTHLLTIIYPSICLSRVSFPSFRQTKRKEKEKATNITQTTTTSFSSSSSSSAVE